MAVNAIRAQAKYLRIATALREGIVSGRHPVGSPLPTIKELANEFDVSFVTAFRAVGVLSSEGLVSTASKRNGTVVLRRTPSLRRSTTIACLLRHPRERNEMDNFALDMVLGLRAEISRHDYRMIYHGLDEKDYERKMVETARGDICGIILDQKTPQSTVKRLLEVGLPTVIFNRHLALPGLSAVSPDLEAVGAATVDYFLERGYERVGFYKMPPGENGWTEADAADHYPLIAMRKGFLDRARAHGLDTDRIILIPAAADSSVTALPETYGLPRRKGADWRPLGILASHDGQAVQILSAIEKTDLALGRDIGIVGCFDLEVGKASPRPPTTWAVNREAIGVAAVRELLNRVEGENLPASSIRLSLSFVDRGTA